MSAWIVALIAALLGLSNPASSSCDADDSANPASCEQTEDGKAAEDGGKTARRSFSNENDISNGF